MACVTKHDFRTNLSELCSLNLDPGYEKTVRMKSDSVAAVINEDDLKVSRSCCRTTYQLKEDFPKLKDVGKVLNLVKGWWIFSYTEPVFIPHGQNESFASEPVAAIGTAFLIDERYVLTAGHVVTAVMQSLEKVRFVFGYEMLDGQNCRSTFEEKNVYQAKKVVGYRHEAKFGEADWALIKLDRPVKGRKKLDLDFSEEVQLQTPIYIIGHPMGLPAKFTRNGVVMESKHPNSFRGAADCFPGNSGSPVFNQNTHKVIGIVSAGLIQDRVIENYGGEEGALRLAVYHISEDERTVDKYSFCQRIAAIAFIRDYFQARQGDCEARVRLAEHYLQGRCASQNTQEQNTQIALKHLRKAAASGWFLWNWVIPWYSFGNTKAQTRLKELESQAAGDTAEMRSLHAKVTVQEAQIINSGRPLRMAESFGICRYKLFFEFWKRNCSLNKKEALEKFIIEYQTQNYNKVIYIPSNWDLQKYLENNLKTDQEYGVLWLVEDRIVKYFHEKKLREDD